MNQLVRDAVAGKQAISEAEVAKAKVNELQSKLAQMEMEKEAAAAPSQPTFPWAWVVVAVVVGLIVGGILVAAFGRR